MVAVFATLMADFAAQPGEGTMASAVERKLSAYNDIALLLARIFIAIMFLIASYNKFKGLGGSATYFTKLGVPQASTVAPIVAAFELISGLLLLVGFKTRLVALAIGVFVIIAALPAHTHFADRSEA